MSKKPFETLHKELMDMLEVLLPEKVDYSTSQRIYSAFKGVREYVESLEARIAKLEPQNDSEINYSVVHMDMTGRIGYPIAKKVTLEQALKVWKEEVVAVISDFYSDEESEQASTDEAAFSRLWNTAVADSEEDPDNTLPRIIRYDTSLEQGWEIIK